jgi:hypothetical protein
MSAEEVFVTLEAFWCAAYGAAKFDKTVQLAQSDGAQAAML